MPAKRHLSLWFPRLAAERSMRLDRGLPPGPFVVVEDQRGAQVIVSMNAEAQAAGLTAGQPLRDARAMCPGLASRPINRVTEATFLTTLRRWAGRFSPWVSEEAPDGLVLDITGCAHLFGGEEALAEEIDRDCARLGLTVRLGLADTRGAAWALARFSGETGGGHRSGDAIDQEARATRSRAVKRRHWTRGGAAPKPRTTVQAPRIAPVGQTRQAIGPLPVAALRLDPEAIEGLNRLGLRRVRDLLDLPRASVTRRFGRGLLDRLDQALGSAQEPVSPTAPPDRFAVRLSFPDPIGLEGDVTEALRRLTDHLCTLLKARGRGARVLRIEAHRCDHVMQWQAVTAAVASADAARLMDLLRMRVGAFDAGPGIDMLRLEAVRHEPLHARTAAGHLEAASHVVRRLSGGAALEDLIGRLGARLGMEAVTRHHPAASHIPEKAAHDSTGSSSSLPLASTIVSIEFAEGTM